MFAVAGGTGLVGSKVVAQLAAAGEPVRVISRHVPDVDSPRYVIGAEYVQADLASGVGLAKALTGVDAVIDTTQSMKRGGRTVLVDGADRLLRTAYRNGVRHGVVLSIVNTDQSRMGYYRSKAAQERKYLDAGAGFRVLRATQFHEFLDMIFRPAARFGVIPVARKAYFQPIDTSEVASELIGSVTAADPDMPIRTVGGPEVVSMRRLAQEWKHARRSRAAIIEMPVPGSFGTFLAEGRNLIPERAVGTITFNDWLRSTASGVSTR